MPQHDTDDLPTAVPGGDTSDDTANDTAAGPSPGPRRRGLLPLVVAGVLVLLTSATSVVLGVQLSRERALDDARTESLAAARDFATELTTYDHRELDEDFAAVLEGSTDPFRSQYADTTEDLRELFQKFQATSTSRLLGSGVADVTEDSAIVVLFVDQTVRNTNSAEPRVDRNRVRVTLKKVDGRWLASEVAVT